MEFLNFNTLIEAVMILLLYLYWKLVPNNGHLFLEVQRLKKLVAQLSEIIEVDRTEMWEHIEGTLKPLSMRMSTRIRRAEQQDLKTSEAKQKGGIIKGSQLKEYGLHR